MSVADRVRVRKIEVLSDNHYILRKATFDWRRSDGSWQTVSREAYDRGDGAALLAYDLGRRTVLLIRQFRYPPFSKGYDDLLIEAAAGILDDAEPEVRVRAEVEEELGYRLGPVKPAMTCFVSPGAVTEKLHLFVAEYAPQMRIGDGGGNHDEGEDIERLELPFDRAMQMVETGEICDAKTILLLQYAALHLFR